MSVAFRRESDDEHLEPKFELPIPPGPNLVTARGLGLLETKVAELEAALPALTEEEPRKKHLRELRYWRTRLATAEHLATKLHQGDVYATALHGGLSQGARQETLQAFKEKRWDVVVTTDLAARGIHIDQLPVVVNFDLPRSAVDYVHRIGRTGRAGHSGLALSFVAERVDDLERQPARLASGHAVERSGRERS